MTIALYVVSALWIAVGTFLIIYTEGTRRVLNKLFPADNVRWIAVFPVVFGLILGVGAFYVREMFWLAFSLGLLAMIKGIYLIAGPPGQIKGLLQWWFSGASEATVRLFGLITFTLGIAIFSYLHH